MSMTEIEAIKELHEIRPRGGIIPQKRAEAIDVAIKALEKQIKKENADGCVGCAFEDVEEWEMPCRKCKRGCKDYWRAKE